MTYPTVLPAGYAGNASDFAKVPGVDRSGAARIQQGSVTVPSLTAADVVVGLLPFQAGARINIHDKSIYAGNFGGATTTLNIGYVYEDNVTYTNDLDAWASLSAAPQAGGFVTVDEKEGLSFVAEGNGWLIAQLKALAADAEAAINFNVTVAYDG